MVSGHDGVSARDLMWQCVGTTCRLQQVHKIKTSA